MKKFLILLMSLSYSLAAQEPNPFDIDPNAPQDDHFYSEIFNMLSSLGLILAGLLLLAWFAKRFTQSRLEQINTTSNIKIIERRPISNKTTIYLVEIEGTGITLAEHSHGVTKLAEFPLEKQKSFEKS